MLYKIALKNMKKNKKRALVTIIAITLSSTLLFTVGFLFSTYRENEIQNIQEKMGAHHITIKGITYNDLKTLEDNDLIANAYPISMETINIIIKRQNYDDSLYINLYKTNRNYLETFDLSYGRLPEKENEVIIPQKLCMQNSNFTVNDIEYKVVGCYKTSITNYNYYTISSLEEEENIQALVHFKDTKDLQEKVDDLKEQLGFDKDIDYNIDLLSRLGVSLDGKSALYNALLNVMVMISCTILGIFALLVIYNSYSLSIKERKRSIGILSSVGATRIQIIKALMFEAMIEFIIGCLIGLFVSYLLMLLGINIINTITISNFKICFYPMYFLICFVILLVFVLLSSVMPSVEASFISPIEVIRSSDEIKNKKVKSKLVSKLFGVEGAIAYRNIKRNKRKYGVTTFSIILSFTVFVVVAIFINLLNLQFGKNNILLPEYDYLIYYDEENIDELISKLNHEVKDMNVLSTVSVAMPILKDELYDNNYPLKEMNMDKKFDYIRVYYLYNQENKTTYVNNINYYYTKDNRTQFYKGKVLNEDKNMNLTLCKQKMDEHNYTFSLENCFTLDNIEYTNNSFLGFDKTGYGNIHNIIVDKETFLKAKEIGTYDYNYEIYIKTDNVQKLEDYLYSLKEDYPLIGNDIKVQTIESYQPLIIFVGITSFILFFITIFSIINIYNALSITIYLRKREFALLRSMGMDNKKFNKMIRLESIFFMVKSIIFGILLSMIIYLWLRMIFKELFAVEKMLNKEAIFYFPLPLKYIGIAIIVLFIVTYTLMRVISRKHNKGNIADILKLDD